MEFSQIEYIDWVKKNFGRAKHNLANSGIFSVDKRLISEITKKSLDWPTSPTKFEGEPDLIGQLAKVYDLPPENFLTASGASEANFLAMASVISEGDTVLVETPTYEPLFRVPNLLGAKVEFIQRNSQNNFKFDLEAIKEVMGKKVSMIVISNPHNPSSEVLSNKDLKELCEIAGDNNCVLLSDEVYRDFVFNNPPKQACELSDSAITTSSLTKVFGLASLRTGWIAADPAIISKCLKMKFHISVISSPVTEKLGYNALLKRERFIKNASKLLEKNVPAIKKWVKGKKYLDVKIPRYGPFIFPKFLGINVTELSNMLINYYETLIVPGKFFGASDYARIAFVCDTKTLKAGLENIDLAVSALS